MEENNNLFPEQKENTDQIAADVTAEQPTVEPQSTEPEAEVKAEEQSAPVVEEEAVPAAEEQTAPAVEEQTVPPQVNFGVAQPMAPQPNYVAQPMGGIYTVPVVNQQPMMQRQPMQMPMRQGYCYQNPYQNFGLYTAPTSAYTAPAQMPPVAQAAAPATLQNSAPAAETENGEDAAEKPAAELKKRKYVPLIVTSAIAGVVLLACCVIIAFGIVRDMAVTDDGELLIYEDEQPEADVEEKPASGAERDENVVYNMPDIQTGEKKGKELSLVEINNKVKNSVTGILISADGEDFDFSGSGVIISEDGYILTNNHVIESARKLKVVLSDGITEYEASVVGKDARSDLAVLKVKAKGLQAAELGNSDQLEVGETVVAIGNPYGLELAGTVTNGIVSALNRKIEINGSFMTLIQTNASINPGNSGGPLVNAYGQVIGITSSKMVATGYEGIGFAIPINHVVDISGELISYGYIKTRGYIGIQGSTLEKEYAEYYGFPQGVYVYYVDPECDAAKKGLKKNDVIIGFAGEEVTSMGELNDLKDQYKPGDSVTLKVWREEKTFEITVTLTEST